jgi:hypothetical protein
MQLLQSRALPLGYSAIRDFILLRFFPCSS